MDHVREELQGGKEGVEDRKGDGKKVRKRWD